MSRNGECPLVDEQSNGAKKALTNAERQRRHRNKRRGGPPVGRWPDGATIGKLRKSLCQRLEWSRTMYYMAQWIIRHAPDVEADVEADKVRITPAYNRLKREMFVGFARFLALGDKSGEGYELKVSRRGGRFHFAWRKRTN